MNHHNSVFFFKDLDANRQNVMFVVHVSGDVFKFEDLKTQNTEINWIFCRVSKEQDQ